MERIKALIEKLSQQEKQGCNPAQLLFTVQLLQTELIKFQHTNGSSKKSKVAITLPVNYHYTEEVLGMPEMETEVNEVPVSPVQKPVLSVKSDTSYIEQKEIKQQVLNPAFDTIVESPTLTQHQVVKEIHEVIAQPKESLNDRLKQDKTEVVHTLKDSPIKDLRKGIGINDRFTFVNELFRGDEAMYERSIKTINGFNIYSEAEYWINRELKLKLGWIDSKEIVQHFCHLVKRRFA